MTQSWNRFRRLAFAAVLLALFAGCEGNSPGKAKPPGGGSVQSIEVHAEPQTIEVGSTCRLSATVRDDNGNVVEDAGVEWSSADPAIATIDPAGVATGLSQGVVVIRARVADVTGEASLTVEALGVASIELQPSALRLEVGAAADLQARALDRNGSEISGIALSWSSEDPETARVEENGSVIAVGAGATRIRASAGSVVGTATVEVFEPAVPVASVEVEPWAGPLFVGRSQELRAIVKAADGTELQGREVSWISNDEAVATVSAAGVATGSGPGIVRITASAEGHEGTLELEVLTPADRIVVTPGQARLLNGELAALSAEVLDASGAPITDRAPTWRTSDSGIVAVDNIGRILALGPGTARITATLDGVEGEATVVVSALRFTAISVGGYTSCGIATDGLAYCWGAWPASTSSLRSHIPRPLSESLTFVDVAVGSSHVCALTAGGSVWCQGNVGGRGALGDGSGSNSDLLVEVAGGHTFRRLAAGVYHTCAIDEAGATWCWGFNADGRLGAGTTTARELEPVSVSGGLALVQVDASQGPLRDSSSTCAVTAEGEAWCWGDGRAGQLGDGIQHTSDVPFPVQVATSLRLDEVETVSLGYGEDFDGSLFASGHSCGRTAQGQVYCWGSNEHGQLGDGSFQDSLVPVAIAGNSRFTSLSIGGQPSGTVSGGTTCGTTIEGAILCWGCTQGAGLLGDGVTSIHSANPVQAVASGSFVDVEVSGAHACALKDDGIVFCWGYNVAGQVGAPANPGVLVPTPVFGQ